MANVFKRFNGFLHRLNIPNWLVILMAMVLVLRIPTFFEPYSYGDEMIYMSLGEGVRQGKVLYRDIHDNKPPLLYLTAAVAGNLFWFKAILAFWSLITIVLFWKLAIHLFPKRKKLSKTATYIFALLSTLPLLEGNIANAENFMIGTTIAAFLILFTKKLNTKNLLLAGGLFSISTLFKVPAVFEVPTIIVFWLFYSKLKIENLKKIAVKTFWISLGFLIPILLTFLWYAIRGGFKEYLIAGFLQNFGYLSSFRPGDVVEPFFVRNLPLLIRGGIAALGVGILFLSKKKLSKQFIFIVTWLLFTLFAVTLSERPYPHYFLQSAPAIAFLFAILITNKTKEQVLTILPLTLTFFIPFYYRFWYYPSASYYTKFVKFAVGKINKQEYFQTFGGHVERSYYLAEIINKSVRKTEKVLVWGSNSSLIYALSKRFPPIRYVAQYHISDFSSNAEVLEAMLSTPPKLIIILPNSPDFPEIFDFLKDNYLLIESSDGAEVWSKISPEAKNLLI